MRICIDTDCKCYTEPSEGMRTFEVPFFDGKCQSFVEGFRYVPNGETWMRNDGKVFSGEMVTPWKNIQELNAAQRKYERQQLAEYETALSEIEVALGV